MPTYEYHCTAGHHFERVLPVANYRDTQTCNCGAEGRRILSLPMLKVSPDVHYDSPVDGRPITSMKKRREDLARNNCQPYDPEMKKDVDTFHRREAERMDKAVDATVESIYEKMPAAKKEKLANELLGGADAQPTRGTPGGGFVKTLPEPLHRTR